MSVPRLNRSVADINQWANVLSLLADWTVWVSEQVGVKKALSYETVWYWFR